MNSEVENYMGMMYGELPETLRESIKYIRPNSYDEIREVIEVWLKYDKVFIIRINGELKPFETNSSTP